MKKSISILGGSGFIGTSVAENLSNSQIKFTISDIKESKSFTEKFIPADIRDFEQLNMALSGCDTVLNLAAVHRDDVTDIDDYYSTNVEGAKRLCEVCKKQNINKIVFTSSVAVYGFTHSETDELGAINPFNEYGRTKALAENIYREWQAKDPENRSLIIIRPTVVFGEGNRGNVYNLINQINSGFFVMIGNGKNKKSMAYVKNISAFIVKCLETEEKVAVYNYVDKPDLSMNELVTFVRGKLKNQSNVGVRIPKFAGLMIGFLADGLIKLGINIPISSVRVKKFCASSEYSTSKSSLDGFEAPFTLQEGINRTLDSEFINPDPDREIFFTE